SISTPFEFDYEPFVDNDGSGKTWNVDGWVKTNPITMAASTDDGQAWRGLVWGCEKPLLLISETFSAHDIRTEDTADEANPTAGEMKSKIDLNDAMKDKDRDQKRRPQSLTLIELYNPSSEPVPAEYRSLRANVTGNAIDLSRLAPASADGKSRPVWQLVLRRE